MKRETWVSKLVIANEKNLTMFLFEFQDCLYVSEWKKSNWSEPLKIIKI